MNLTNVKTIYISLPIAGQEDTVYERNEEAVKFVKSLGKTPISPIDINHIDDKALGNHLKIEKTAYYMGRDIEQVILCDAILMCSGWENSKGCKVEKYTAEIYGKKIFYL